MNRSENRARSCPSLQNLTTPVAALPVGHLQLSGGARRAVANFKTIGRLAHKLEEPTAYLSFSYVAWADICSVSRQLHSSRRGGRLDWDRFRRSRPLQADPDWIYFMSPKLGSVKKNDRIRQIGALHLSRRAVNALSPLELCTVGELIDHSRRGIHGLRNIGRLTQFEITESLDALSEAISNDGSVSWTRYAKARGFALLPAKCRRRWTPHSMVLEIPKAFEAAISVKYGQQMATLFRNHTCQPPSKATSLVTVSSRFGLTKQRASFAEKSIVALLSRVIWEENYRGCPFRFREEFLAPLQSLRRLVDARKSSHLSVADWTALLKREWNLTRGQTARVEGLFLRLLGLQLFSAGSRSVPLDVPQRTKSGWCERAVRRIVRALHDHPNGLVASDIRQLLEEQYPASSLPDLHSLLSSSSKVEYCSKENSFRITFEALRRDTDKAERILREGGRALHFRELAARMAAGGKSASKFLPEQLSKDSRFTPIGRSGFWGLVEWGLETRSVVTIALEILRGSPAPMRVRQLFDRISTCRLVNYHSLARQLAADARFRKVGPGQWTAVLE